MLPHGRLIVGPDYTYYKGRVYCAGKATAKLHGYTALGLLAGTMRSNGEQLQSKSLRKQTDNILIQSMIGAIARGGVP